MPLGRSLTYIGSGAVGFTIGWLAGWAPPEDLGLVLAATLPAILSLTTGGAAVIVWRGRASSEGKSPSDDVLRLFGASIVLLSVFLLIGVHSGSAIRASSAETARERALYRCMSAEFTLKRERKTLELDPLRPEQVCPGLYGYASSGSNLPTSSE